MKLSTIIVVMVGLSVLTPTTSHGERLWGDEGQIVNISPSYYLPSVCPRGEDGVLVGYSGIDSTGRARVAIQTVNYDGNLEPAESPIYLTDGTRWVARGSVVVRKLGNDYLVFWKYNAPFETFDAAMMRLDRNLNTVWQEQIIFSSNDEFFGRFYEYGDHPAFMATNDGGLLIVEDREIRVDNQRDYREMLHKFDAAGRVSEGWPEGGRDFFNSLCYEAHMVVEEGEGIWGYAKGGRAGQQPVMINFVDGNGEMRWDEAIMPELTEMTLDVPRFEPDLQGGFYLAIEEFAEEREELQYGFQRYDREGNPVWEWANIWQGWVPMEHLWPRILVAEEGEFVYFVQHLGLGEGRNDLNAIINCFEPGEEGPVSHWDDWTFFANTEVEPLYVNSNQELLVKLHHYGWGQDGFMYQNSTVNFLAADGGLGLEEADVEAFYSDLVVPGLDDDFYVGRIGNQSLIVQCYGPSGNAYWDGAGTTVYAKDYFSMDSRQVLDGGVVRIIMQGDGGIYYRLLEPDGSFRGAGDGELVVDWPSIQRTASSAGSFCIISLDEEREPRDVVVFDGENNLNPEQPMGVEELIGGGALTGLAGDSVGGFFVYHTLSEEAGSPTVIKRLNERCELAAGGVLPFGNAVIRNMRIVPDCQGGAWIVGEDNNRGYQLRKIRADNSLEWEAARRLDCVDSLRNSKRWFAWGDSVLAFATSGNSRHQDSTNVYFVSFNGEGERLRDEAAAFFDPNPGIPAGPSGSLSWIGTKRRDGGMWIIAYDEVVGTSSRMLKLQGLTAGGERICGGQGLRLPGSQNGPTIATDNEDGVWVFVIKDSTVSDGLLAFHFDRNGEVISEAYADGCEVVHGGPANSEYMLMREPWIYGNNDCGVLFSWSMWSYVYRAQRLSDEPGRAAEDRAASPAGFAITGCYPSPTNGMFNIAYRLDKRDAIELKLYDVSGRLVKELARGVELAGDHIRTVDAGGISSGSYLIELRAGGKSKVRWVVELK